VQRPGDRAAIRGDESDDDMRVGEVRAPSHEHHVGKRHEAAAEPDGGAVDRSDDRWTALDHRHHEPLAGVDRHPAQRWILGDLLQVAEVAAG
jgi:hypothetical protein